MIIMDNNRKEKINNKNREQEREAALSHHLNSLWCLCMGLEAWSQGWRPVLEVLAPVVPAQLCTVIDTCSTVLVSGSQNSEHRCHLAKIVPGAGVASGAIFIPSCFCGGLSSQKACVSPYECIMIYIWWGFIISNRQQQRAQILRGQGAVQEVSGMMRVAISVFSLIAMVALHCFRNVYQT